ncbi:hypothetical protein SH449x_004047 [Pirellulaceae bacterium SH449]
MKIESSSNSYWNQSPKNRADNVDMVSMLAPAQGARQVAETESSQGFSSDLDFSNMTRRELFDWMNNQIRSGQMTVDESTPFLAMSLKVKLSGEPVDMDTDPIRMDFVDIAKQRFDAAESRGDFEIADRWRIAWNSLQQLQGTLPSLDFLA